MDDLLARAQAGERGAFAALIEPHRRALRQYLVRLVANIADADDILQDALVRAHEKLATFRGDASFKTWIHSIATNLALTHLKTRKRWADTAQLEMHEKAGESPAFLADLGAAMGASDYRYEVAEHIAYCFACVGRSLAPEESAALLLVEVFAMKTMEAAQVLGMNESTLRHRLSAARSQMEESFGRLCTLVSKTGACHQCAILRDASPSDRRGPDLPSLAGENAYPRRLGVVRDGDFASGTTHAIHERMLRFIAQHLD